MSSGEGSPLSKYRCLAAGEGFGGLMGRANQAFHVSVAIDGEEASSRMMGGVEGSAAPMLCHRRVQFKEFREGPA